MSRTLSDASSIVPVKAVGAILVTMLATGAFSSFGIGGVASSASAFFDSDSPTAFETGMLDRINGTAIWTYDETLEEISTDHLAFRSAGSSGANETSEWIEGRFLDFGLDTRTESFEFVTWDLMDRPKLTIDVDGSLITDSDKVSLESFQCEHFSWPTSGGVVSAPAVILPLPYAIDRGSIEGAAIDEESWGALDTEDMVVFVGREVRWNADWAQKFFEKISADTPVAVVFIWWYDWMDEFPPAFYPSTGGRPLGATAGDYWDLEISTGSVNFTESVLLKDTFAGSEVHAIVSIPSSIASGNHSNVIGRLQGEYIPEQMILVTGHYDTVMDPGFCDNGAGVAGVLEIASMVTEAVNEGFYQPRYSILFVAFTGEELGLAGSVNFVKAHMAEMNDIVAVLNLDCIGGLELTISMTESSDDTDLDEIARDAAEDLGVAVSVEGFGGSDQETFRNPTGVEYSFDHDWNADAGISEAHPIAASVMFSSSPTLYSDMWTDVAPGWIHTSFDSSSSAVALNWIDELSLENHVRVAALTLLRLSPDVPDGGVRDSTIEYVVMGAVALIVITVVSAAIYFNRRR